MILLQISTRLFSILFGKAGSKLKVFLLYLKVLMITVRKRTCLIELWAAFFHGTLFSQKNKKRHTIVIQTWVFGRYLLKNKVICHIKGNNTVFVCSDKIQTFKRNQNFGKLVFAIISLTGSQCLKIFFRWRLVVLLTNRFFYKFYMMCQHYL